MTMPRDSAPQPAICNIEAEQAILGALLLNNEVLDRIGFLQPEHFYEPVHGRIFKVARDWVQAGKLASPVTLKPVLADDEGLQELGGTDYLARLAGATISITSARDYAETVMELYSRREVITAAESAITIAGAFDETGGAAQAIEHLDGDLDAIRGNTQRRAPSVSFGKAMVSAMERMVEARGHQVVRPGGGDDIGDLRREKALQLTDSVQLGDLLRHPRPEALIRSPAD